MNRGNLGKINGLENFQSIYWLRLSAISAKSAAPAV